MLDILLLVLQIVTLILLFLFIWWVVRSARRDLVRSAEGPQVAGGQQPLPWDDAGWPAPAPGDADGAGWAALPAAQGAEWDWQTDAGDVAPPAHTDVPYVAAESAVLAAPDVTDGGRGPSVSSPPDVQARLDTRLTERAAVARGLDMTGVVHARLVVESSPVLMPGQEIPLGGWLGIGRSPASDLALNDSFVSSTHARVVRRGQYFFVEDLGSTNGTFVNERQVTEAQLKLDTRLRIGETVFRYEE